MDFQRIGSRGLLFTWMEPYHTNVYVTVGTRHVFVIDTFLGPEPMEAVKTKLAEEVSLGSLWWSSTHTPTTTTSGGTKPSEAP